MKKFLSSILLASVLCVMALPQAVHAQVAAEEGLEYLLFEEVPTVFLTTKRVEKTNESAINIRVINREDIERWGFQTLSQLFSFIENTMVAPKGVDNVYNVRGIIGYANDKIKFLVDGFEMPFMFGLGEGEWPVTLDEVKRIEIVKGPNTSIFGGNATQATINVIRYNGSDFQGTRVGVAIGENDHRRVWIHHADAPTDEFNYDVYFNTTYSEGYDASHHEWWHGANDAVFSLIPTNPDFADIDDTGWNAQDRNTPLPDHELIASVNYTDFRMMVRRVEAGAWRFSRYVRNYTDAAAFEVTSPEFLGNENMDLVVTVEASAFGQQYDFYHNQHFSVAQAPTTNIDGIEHKAEKRLEWDAHIHYDADTTWDLLAGIGGNYWRAEGAEWGGYFLTAGGFPNLTYAPSIGSGTVSDEYFPAFTEINDLANIELWADWKWSPMDNVNVVLGGRYVSEYEPDDQLRGDDGIGLFAADREELDDFFPKAAVVWLPADRMAIKLMYQEGYNRPNTFEQFTLQNNVERRGKNKATTAETIELVLDWTLNDNWHTLVSVFDTEIKDFMNFVYTGAAFPVITPGQFIGFDNVGDQEVQGLEASLEAKYDNFGGLINFGLLDQNEITPIATFDPVTGGGGTGATGIIDTSDFNKQTVPEWTLTAGAWVRPMDNVTLSVLYKTQQDVKNNHNRGNTFLSVGSLLIDETDYEQIDVILNVDDFVIENLDLQLLAQNIGDEDDLIGDALNPVHAIEVSPAYYQVKFSYLWGETA